MSTNIHDIQRVIKSANKESLNWFPLVQLLSVEIEPEDIARDLLNVYFSIAEYLISYPGELDLSKRELNTLRSIYEALNEMTKAEMLPEGLKVQILV